MKKRIKYAGTVRGKYGYVEEVKAPLDRRNPVVELYIYPYLATGINDINKRKYDMEAGETVDLPQGGVVELFKLIHLDEFV